MRDIALFLRRKTMRIRPEESVCMVIDYQEKLVPAVAEREKFLAKSEKLLHGMPCARRQKDTDHTVQKGTG